MIAHLVFMQQASYIYNPWYIGGKMHFEYWGWKKNLQNFRAYEIYNHRLFSSLEIVRSAPPKPSNVAFAEGNSALRVELIKSKNTSISNALSS